MGGTGVGFALATTFWPLLLVAILGTLNPSSGDVSVFLPTEQAYLADRVDDEERPRLFAVYNVAGSLAGALGALASGAPAVVADALGRNVLSVQRASFVMYIAAAAAVFGLYRSLPSARPIGPSSVPVSAAAPFPRRVILQLAALFSVDSAASGLAGTTLLVLWLRLRSGLSAEAMGAVFFGVALLGAASQFLAPVVARRIGLIRTTVFTHLPANVVLILAALAPSGSVAVTLLLLRAGLSQMDVPARQAFVMAIVPSAQRAAAASITNVPRSLAAATTPLAAGALLAHSSFGWPLVVAGVMKVGYDLTLLALYRDVPAAPQ